MADNQVRQNFHKNCEDAINKQINMELYASYVYLSMVCITFEYLTERYLNFSCYIVYFICFVANFCRDVIL